MRKPRITCRRSHLRRRSCSLALFPRSFASIRWLRSTLPPSHRRRPEFALCLDPTGAEARYPLNLGIGAERARRTRRIRSWAK
jgi:hypothetical protein